MVVFDHVVLQLIKVADLIYLKTTICVATVITTCILLRVLYIYAFPKTCLRRSQLHLIPFLTPLKVVSAVITCQMRKDCGTSVGKSKESGH